MTNEEKIRRFKKIVQNRLSDGSHDNGKELLIKEGILNPNGTLSKNYGGET